MASKKSFTLYLLVLFLTPLTLFYILGAEVPRPYSGEGSYGICFVIILSGPAAFYAVYWVKNKFFSKNIEFSDINKERPKEHPPVENRSKRSRTLDLFNSKNECESCGTEMEYKEGMDCYYCPECHEYK